MLMCRPAIIVRPYSAEDVAIVVTFAVRHGFQVTTFTQQSGIVLKYILRITVARIPTSKLAINCTLSRSTKQWGKIFLLCHEMPSCLYSLPSENLATE